MWVRVFVLRVPVFAPGVGVRAAACVWAWVWVCVWA